MSLIHVARNNQVLGQFTDDEVKDGLNSGKLLLTDLAWRTGMAQWTPFSSWPEFSPGAAALAGAPAIPPPEIPKPLPAPAWERREELGNFVAIRDSVKAILMKPSETFAAMPVSGGLGRPFAFCFSLQLVSNAVLSFSYVLFFFIILQIVKMDPSVDLSKIPEEFLNVGPVAGGLILFVMMTLMAAIGIFFTPAITHVSLMITRGAVGPFEATFRVSAYTWGAFALVYCPFYLAGMIPIIGSLFSFLSMGLGVWMIVVNILGLLAVHKGADTWRIVLGYFLPMIVCCVLVMISWVAIIAIIAANGGFHSR
ncbi:MAG: GYF domain-containing protein [Puniceicoccales bacterium]|nr:GYF domain-containing protein [Puniceicoccales bacterium]